MSGWERVASLAQLRDGDLVPARTAGGRAICIFRHQGVVGAAVDACSHADFPLSDGTLLPDGSIECVWHGARFDCRSGEPLKGPATDPIDLLEVRIEGDSVFVCAPEARTA
ncbi:MAG: Rieske (2Fe-2S) domain protein [Gemmatimonadetes bacterium]|nr:Rieske (2Fe-2S) domain protein [Gemmatimonadota bacterium]